MFNNFSTIVATTISAAFTARPCNDFSTIEATRLCCHHHCGHRSAAVALRSLLCGLRYAAFTLRPSLCGRRYAAIAMRPSVCGRHYTAIAIQPSLYGRYSAGAALRPSLCGRRSAAITLWLSLLPALLLAAAITAIAAAFLRFFIWNYDQYNNQIN